MKRAFYFINVGFIVLGLSLVDTQAQRATEGSRKQTTQAQQINLSTMLAQARPQRAAGFSLMRAGSVAPMAGANLQVLGSGRIGRLTKWTGLTSSNSFVGDTTIFEDKFGNVGIGTDTPTSKLTVAGMVQITLGGLMFPDGTVQTTAGISFVTHDASLAGLGNAASPLGIALGGVQTSHLATGAVTAPKIANGAVVRSLNGLFDNVTLAATSPISITQSGNTLTIASPNSLTSVTHDSTLTGTGSSVSPLGVANGGIGNAQLADNSVSLSKIAPNQVVTTLNSLTENVTLAGGSNITVNKSGNTLTIDGSVGSSIAYHAHNGGSDFLNNPGLDVISKQVPAGRYIIFFRAQMFSNDTGGDQNVQCTLSTGDTAGIRLGDQAGLNMGMLVLQDAATLSATTTITVHCAGFKVVSFGNVLTALKVDSIQ